MVALTVNGEVQEVRDGQSLLHALREDLGLKGTRFGCGEEGCGACTVLLDGVPRFACTLPVEDAAGKRIETVEALGPPEHPRHPLAKAVIDEQAAQCGYCLPGILMAAKALLDVTPDPSDAEIRAALDGHLCRCGAHLRILRAIRRTANSLTAEA